MPVALDRGDDGQPVRPADREVVGAEGRCLVHQAGAVVGGDVVGEHDEVRARRSSTEVERAPVGPALQLAAGQRREHLGVVAEHLASAAASATTKVLVAGARDDVVDVRVDRDGGVRHERPRRRRPDQQVGLAGPRAGRQREADVDRRVGDVLVALRDLVVGQRGAAARAVRRDAVVLDEQALVEDRLQCPPDRLDVVGRIVQYAFS